MSAAELILSKGADVNATDDDWWTPLHMACSCDSVDVLQLLLNVSIGRPRYIVYGRTTLYNYGLHVLVEVWSSL